VPHSMAACAVLVMKRRRRDASILFVDARTLLQDTHAGTWMDASTIDRMLDICRARVCVPGTAALVPTEQVIASGACLSVSRHIPTVAEVRSVPDVAAVRAERGKLIEQLLAMQTHLDIEIDALSRALQSEAQAGCDITGSADSPNPSRHC
jgi:hypothetical protein